MKRTLILIVGLTCLLAANDEVPQKIQATKTEHAELPAGGTVTFKNSTGELTIEGWDQSGVEITTTKSTKLSYAATGAEHDKAARMLDEVKVSAALQGSELGITTEFPRHERFLPRPSVGARDFDLEYVVKVPRDAKLTVDHASGEVHIDDVTGDIHATTIQGQILLRLPATAQYTIDAKCRIGAVTSDFPGITKREHFGHSLIQSAQAPHNLYLRNGFGDILILQIHHPAPLP
jgi:hypothetical protein